MSAFVTITQGTSKDVVAANTLARFGLLKAADLFPEIQAYQELCNIRPATGGLGPITTRCLFAEEAFDAYRIGSKYRGLIGHIIAVEGTVEKPYWPGGNSGVTLDPGFDLGQQDYQTFVNIYDGVFSSQQLKLLQPAIGLDGELAERWLNKNRAALAAAGVIVPPVAIPSLMAALADLYWEHLKKRCPEVMDLPAEVQMAVLSIFYNTGYARLDMLRGFWRAKDWSALAAAIEAIPFNAGRRKYEASLVRRVLS